MNWVGVDAPSPQAAALWKLIKSYRFNTEKGGEGEALTWINYEIYSFTLITKKKFSVFTEIFLKAKSNFWCEKGKKIDGLEFVARVGARKHASFFS